MCYYPCFIPAGIVSRGRGCARSGFPGIYTRVKSHLAWIHGVTRRCAQKWHWSHSWIFFKLCTIVLKVILMFFVCLFKFKCFSSIICYVLYRTTTYTGTPQGEKTGSAAVAVSMNCQIIFLFVMYYINSANTPLPTRWSAGQDF